ncbi:MAG TPA: hypothetical protein VG963_14105 [Polyangiaceae bacterium]|nr:hypothetical protein [Polyangiaceae bacterium]
MRLRGGLFVVQAAGNYCIRWLRKNKNAARDPKVCGMVIGIFEDQLNA